MAQSTAIAVVEHLSKPVLSGGGRFASEDALPIPNDEINMGDAMPSLITDPTSHGTAASPAPVQAAQRSVRVSQLSPGMLLTPILPVYPAIARAAGVSGQVIVSAVISSTELLKA